MTHIHLRTLLEDAAADVEPPHMVGAAVVGVRRRHARRRIAAGTTVLAVGAVGFGIAVPVLHGESDTSGPAANAPHLIAERAPVNDAFTCEHTVVVPPQGDPEIYRDGPGDFGVGHLGASRYEVIDNGPGQRIIQVGDAQGNLAAYVNLRHGTDGWIFYGYEHCTGPDGAEVPVDGRFRLGTHGRPIPPVSTLDGPGPLRPKPTSSVIGIDDRPFYNQIGIVEHRTLYAYETGPRNIAIADVAGGQRAASTEWTAGDAPMDLLGSGFLPTEPPSGATPKSQFAGWAYYTHNDATLTGQLHDGRDIAAETYRGDDWHGTLHIVLAPSDDLISVTLRANGTTTVTPVRD